jgi:OHCU decarboxylase
MKRATLAELNAADKARFVEVCGPLFEHSPWIAERTYARRPFADLASLHATLVATVNAASVDEQLGLIRAHPDLVGRAALACTLTAESTREQSSAGLGSLTADEIATFSRYNSEYRERFGFPFVICARENKKDAILAAFPVRLQNTPEAEIATALAEIAKIAWLRLADAVSDKKHEG